MIQAFAKRCAVAVATTVVGGCGGDAGAGVDHLVSDSAGVAVVDNFRPVWGEDQGWHIDPIPQLTIGVLEGERPYIFSAVSGAVRLSGERIAVLDGDAFELRVYDSEGRFLEARGGRGGGPGEFRSEPVQLILSAGDTLLVLAGDVSRFDENLEFVDRWVPDRGPARAILPEGRSSEGLHLMSDGGFVVPAHEIPPPGAPASFRRPGGYILVGPTGETALLEPFPSNSYASFGRASPYAAGGNPLRLVMADNERYEISVFAPDGGLIQRIRNARPNERISADDLRETRRLLVESAPNPEVAQEWLRLFDGQSHPETRPAFGTLFIDRTSHVWVRDRIPEAFDASAVAIWDVYDPEGIFLGQVPLPAMMRVNDIGEDFVLGRFISDPMGTQQVRQYRLHRPRH